MKNTKTMEQTLTIGKPTVDDGALMWQLVKESTLDLNSPYKYIMMCEYFQETCVVVKEDEKLLGFITGFILPERPDAVFVWQVGVDSSQRGKGLASKMLNELVTRVASEKVRYLEATITPSNIASQSLFRGLARNHQTECLISECFSEDIFPGEGHEAEQNYRIGPFSK